MSSRSVSLILQLAALVCFIALYESAVAQSTKSETEESKVVLARLSQPLYPPLSRQARIGGEVKIQVGIRRDGSIASAEAISGHPMLKQAALESAQRSTFECEGCTEEVTSYVLTYTFGFREDGPDCGIWRLRSAKCLYLWRCGDRHRNPPRMPEVKQSLGHITILADAVCVETSSANSSGG